MVHELLGIHNNRVDMREVPAVRKELQEVVLSSEQDPFFKANMFNNFGELGIAVKQLVGEFQVRTKNNQSIQSISDMKRFVEDYPEFRKLSGNVSKHVSVMGELSRLMEERHLLDVSELEQELACKQDHSSAVKKISKMLAGDYNKYDLLKLVMIYALRYEESSSNQLSTFIELLFERGLTEDEVGLLSALTAYAGAASRMGDLFENSNLLKIARYSITRGLKGVDNIYTEHTPQLQNILESLCSSRLKESDYPYVLGSPSKDRPRDVIVFIVGGATFEEGFCVHQFNSQNTFGVRVVLGGTTVHNSKSFFRELGRVHQIVNSSYSGKRKI